MASLTRSLGALAFLTLAGGVGDLLQRAQGSVITSRLILHFFDGSIDDETTIFSQAHVFRFISDHHVQLGPSFPTPIDVSIDAAKELVSVVDQTGKVTQSSIEVPLDDYNGMASTVLMNLPAGRSDIRIGVLISAAKPRIIHLAMKNVGEDPAFVREEGPLYEGGPIWRIQQISAKFSN